MPVQNEDILEMFKDLLKLEDLAKKKAITLTRDQAISLLLLVRLSTSPGLSLTQ